MDAACEAADGTVSARPTTRRVAEGDLLQIWRMMIARPVPVSAMSFTNCQAICHFNVAFPLRMSLTALQGEGRPCTSRRGQRGVSCAGRKFAGGRPESATVITALAPVPDLARIVPFRRGGAFSCTVRPMCQTC